MLPSDWLKTGNIIPTSFQSEDSHTKVNLLDTVCSVSMWFRWAYTDICTLGTRGFTKEEDKWTKWAMAGAQSELEEICENQNLTQKLASKWEKEISSLMKKTTLFYNSYTGSLISNWCTNKAPLLRKQSQTWDHCSLETITLSRM